MHRFHFCLAAVAFALLLLTPPAAAEEKPADVSLDREVDQYLEETQTAWDDPSTLRAFWKNGFNFETSDGAFQLGVHGRLMWDTHWRTSSDPGIQGITGMTADGTYFRRVRLGVSGTVHKQVFFALNVEFAGSAVAFKGVFVGLKNITKDGTLLFGQEKEPFTISEKTSSRFIMFMERPTPVQAFSPGYQPGIAFRKLWMNGRINLQTGLYKPGASNGLSIGDAGYAWTTRVTGLVIDNPAQQTLLHLGVGFSLRDAASDMARFRARPGTGNGPRIVDTGLIPADDVTLYSFELAFVWRQITVQAEFLAASADGASVGGADVDFTGWYIQVGWFITGETRPYKRSSGSFTRVKPKKNFHDGSGGWGAWEILLRFDTLDLNDGPVTGGQVDTFVVGSTWWWNPNTRVMFNLVFADLATVGDLTVFEMRFQFDF